MQKPNNSPSTDQSNGTLGPIQMQLQLYLQQSFVGVEISEDTRKSIEHTYYAGAAMVYNVMVECMRRDPTLATMTIITAAMATDMNKYFESLPPATVN